MDGSRLWLYATGAPCCPGLQVIGCPPNSKGHCHVNTACIKLLVILGMFAQTNGTIVYHDVTVSKSLRQFKKKVKSKKSAHVTAVQDSLPSRGWCDVCLAFSLEMPRIISVLLFIAISVVCPSSKSTTSRHTGCLPMKNGY